jgi:hypothetical protein
MRYVIIRDDDTNALTPVSCLERLYRPLLDRGWPVNLATIPAVAIDTKMPDGCPEGYLNASETESDSTCHSRTEDGRIRPIGTNRKLVSYLLENPGYRIVQHGCHHDYLEFDRPSQSEVSQRLDKGAQLLMEAGFPRPQSFVAPYDKLSRTSLIEVARRFRVLSTGWFELGRLPRRWWPRYVIKKLKARPHWRIDSTLLLSHPGCLLSYTRSKANMLETIMDHINGHQLTVLVTHWWEYFRGGHADEPFIDLLHQTADRLASRGDIKVIAFSDLVEKSLPLN